MMAWVFANWWQVLIVFYCAGAFVEILDHVVRQRLSFKNLEALPWFMRFTIIVAPLVWPISYISAFVLWRRKSNTVVGFDVASGGFNVSVHNKNKGGKSWRRILQALTEEYPPGEGAKHGLMLGDEPGSMLVTIHFEQGVPPMVVGLTKEELKLGEEDLFNEICDFVDDHAEEFATMWRSESEKLATASTAE